MPQQDTSEIKRRIINILRIRGPSLPVHIAKEIGTSILFTSAFLSELVSERAIRMSYMRVGSSPIYFLPGQEPRLENFYQHLKNKEQDAFRILKQKKFLRDISQEPAIRVALREIKDFAIPFKKNDEIFWKFFTTPETELKLGESAKKRSQTTSPIQKPSQPQEELNIFDKPALKKSPKKPKPKKTKKTSSKVNEKFLDKVKEYISNRSGTILGIEGLSKNELILRVTQEGKEIIIVALNKKRITEKDIIKAYSRARDLSLPYKILCLGELTKKISEFIEAIKDLENIEKLG